MVLPMFAARGRASGMRSQAEPGNEEFLVFGNVSFFFSEKLTVISDQLSVFTFC
ncbi:Uncharacterized protein dnm_036070 [Desulfonema magnum]|uniref:Uncharacterized protein n=1 Tax=Desulfonema magnum TaxID=45655 RepID=A0A975BLW1_9BACT|nr:Uncharacterized protein dnm_036070 [Desulfonema magnum]